MSYPEAISFLYGLRLFGTALGLENSFRLAALAGNPQEHLRFIHVAGTNGKGSTCAMLESIYRRAGLRTGLFTSPHLVSFTERVQVDRVPIPPAEVARLTSELRDRLGGEDPAAWVLRPTFFEFVTVLALIHFAARKCDIVIWETGLGGRLDATNIVTPLASVITNIQYDHQHWLGNSLEEIAREKAGIIKPGVPVITGAADPAALKVIEGTAAALRAPLTIVRDSGAHRNVSLRGEHQQMNAAAALAAVSVLEAVLPVNPRVAESALATIAWPGRLQLIREESREILLDGAHNPDGARTLAAALKHDFGGREFTLVLGVFKDKAWTEICETLAPLARRILLVPLHSDRSADPAQLAEFCRSRWPTVPAAVLESTAAALDASRGDSFVVAAGSLHLIGEAMEHLGLGADAASERALNEWDAGNRGAAAAR